MSLDVSSHSDQSGDTELEDYLSDGKDYIKEQYDVDGEKVTIFKDKRQEYDGEPERTLTKGGVSEAEYYVSNFYLNGAHTLSSTTVHRTTFDNGDKPLGQNVISGILETILKRLNLIETNHDMEQKNIDEVKELVSEAIVNEVNVGNSILYEINDRLKELDELYNGDTAYQHVEVDKYGDPIHEKDRIKTGF
jgi:hypothetical protein